MKYNLFWIRVQKMMDVQKIGISELAENTGICVDVLRSWIFRNYTPSAVNVNQIGECLGVSMEYLVWGMDYVKKHGLSIATGRKKQPQKV